MWTYVFLARNAEYSFKLLNIYSACDLLQLFFVQLIFARHEASLLFSKI